MLHEQATLEGIYGKFGHFRNIWKIGSLPGQSSLSMASTGYRDTQVLDGGKFEFLQKNSNDSGHLCYMNRLHWSEFMVSLDILGIFGKTGHSPLRAPYQWLQQGTGTPKSLMVEILNL